MGITGDLFKSYCIFVILILLEDQYVLINF